MENIYLAIDIGNTWIKSAFYSENGEPLKFFQHKYGGKEYLADLLKYAQPKYTIICNVRSGDSKALIIPDSYHVLLNVKCILPFKNLYATPNTLGVDRIAAVAGGWAKFPNKDILIITAGTCITYNFINKNGEFLGGSISPGLTMRYKALNHFTGKLPYIKHQLHENLIGKSTEEAILAGVQGGLLAEVDSIINQYKALYPNINIIITGGGAVIFENRLKNKIFADQKLILLGLYNILKLNVKKS